MCHTKTFEFTPILSLHAHRSLTSQTAQATVVVVSRGLVTQMSKEHAEQFAAVIRELPREQSIAGRKGGESFCVYLGGTTPPPNRETTEKTGERDYSSPA